MSESRSVEELTALWAQVFGQPPAIKASAAELAMLLVRHLPQVAPYQPKPFREAGDPVLWSKPPRAITSLLKSVFSSPLTIKDEMQSTSGKIELLEARLEALKAIHRQLKNEAGLSAAFRNTEGFVRKV